MQKSNRFYSLNQEKRVSQLIQGRPQPNSGATDLMKGDVRAGKDLLVEAKTITKPQKSRSIQLEWLEKIREEAFGQGYPLSALAFDFENGGTQYFVLREDDFVTLFESWKQLNHEGEYE